MLITSAQTQVTYSWMFFGWVAFAAPSPLFLKPSQTHPGMYPKYPQTYPSIWVNYSIGWILGRWDVKNRSFWYGNQSFCPLRAGTETSERGLFVGGFLGESCPQKWRKNAGQFESSMFRLSGICFTTFVDRVAQRRREIAALGLNLLFPGPNK